MNTLYVILVKFWILESMQTLSDALILLPSSPIPLNRTVNQIWIMNLMESPVNTENLESWNEMVRLFRMLNFSFLDKLHSKLPPGLRFSNALRSCEKEQSWDLGWQRC
jgi:hypothetical protein